MNIAASSKSRQRRPSEFLLLDSGPALTQQRILLVQEPSPAACRNRRELLDLRIPQGSLLGNVSASAGSAEVGRMNAAVGWRRVVPDSPVEPGSFRVRRRR